MMPSELLTELTPPLQVTHSFDIQCLHRRYRFAGVTAYLKPSVSGFLLQKELEYLQGAVDVPKRPFAAIVGGSKVSSKISVIESMLAKVDKLVLGGGMVFTFLKVSYYYSFPLSSLRLLGSWDQGGQITGGG